MADRFFASYEDEFNSRPNSGRSGVLPKFDDRFYVAPEQYQQDPFRPEPQFQADPYDRPSHVAYDREDEYATPPIFAPLDRRAGSSAQSYPAQPRYDRPHYEEAHYAPQDIPRAYDRQQGGPSPERTPNSYGQSSVVRTSDRVAKGMQWAGTICSVLVLLGAVYWAYELAVRDARGIPVVRAAEGPLRIAPTSPGGEVYANQGLAINSIAAKGGSEPLPDVVTLAPAPVQLAQEDVATSVETPAAVAETEEISTPEIIAEPTGSALTDLAAKTPDVMPISDEAAVEAALAMALSGETVTKSTTDAAQPVEMANLDTALTAPTTSEVDPASIPAGTKLVQLGAFDDDASARAAWAGLQTQFADLMGSKTLVVQQAKSGGRVFFRLRAHGFANEDETRRFCAALLAENASCIPVSQR